MPEENFKRFDLPPDNNALLTVEQWQNIVRRHYPLELWQKINQLLVASFPAPVATNNCNTPKKSLIFFNQPPFQESQVMLPTSLWDITIDDQEDEEKILSIAKDYASHGLLVAVLIVVWPLIIAFFFVGSTLTGTVIAIGFGLAVAAMLIGSLAGIFLAALGKEYTYVFKQNLDAAKNKIEAKEYDGASKIIEAEWSRNIIVRVIRAPFIAKNVFAIAHFFQEWCAELKKTYLEYAQVSEDVVLAPTI